MPVKIQSYEEDIAEAKHPATTGERLLQLVHGNSSQRLTPLRDACLTHPNFPLEELREWMGYGELTSWTNISAQLAVLARPGGDLVQGAIDAARYLVDTDEPLDAKELCRRLCARQRQAQRARCQRKRKRRSKIARREDRDPTGRATALLLAVLQHPG